MAILVLVSYYSQSGRSVPCKLEDYLKKDLSNPIAVHVEIVVVAKQWHHDIWYQVRKKNGLIMDPCGICFMKEAQHGRYCK